VSLADPREELVRVSRLLYLRGLVTAAGGNVSFRVSDEMFWITPSGPHKGTLSPSDVVLMSTSGEVVETSGRKPSSEWRMHAAVYRARTDARAVVHTHGPLSTTLGTTSGVVRPMSEEGIIYLGGAVRCIRWRRAGTWELAEAVANSLRDSNAVIIERHGAVTLGPTLEIAAARAEALEEAAELYLGALTSPRACWRSVLWP